MLMQVLLSMSMPSFHYLLPQRTVLQLSSISLSPSIPNWTADIVTQVHRLLAAFLLIHPQSMNPMYWCTPSPVYREGPTHLGLMLVPIRFSSWTTSPILKITVSQAVGTPWGNNLSTTLDGALPTDTASAGTNGPSASSTKYV